MQKEPGQDYLIEFVRIGNSVKVSAIDPVTCKEAAIIGPAGASVDVLSKRAIAKLQYVIAKSRKSSQSK